MDYGVFTEIRKNMAPSNVRGRVPYYTVRLASSMPQEVSVTSVGVETDEVYCNKLCVYTHTMGEAYSTCTDWINEKVVEEDELFVESFEQESHDTYWGCLLTLSSSVLGTGRLRVSSTLRNVTGAWSLTKIKYT